MDEQPSPTARNSDLNGESHAERCTVAGFDSTAWTLEAS
jgi:hypothetical protein